MFIYIIHVNTFINHELNTVWQAKKETIDKVCDIVKEKLALGADVVVTADSEFSKLGADSLDTVHSFSLPSLSHSSSEFDR